MMRTMRWLLAGLLFFGAAGAADLVPRATKKLDAYFDGLQQQGLVSGSIAISERGSSRYRRSIGFATIEKGVPYAADEGTRYRIGSITRLFTAVLTMQLAEQATLTLDNKLAEFYPDLPNAIGISYRNLLQERSGLSNYQDAKDYATWRTTPRTHAEMMKVISEGGTHFAPGERVEYNDTNYLLLGYVLEKVYERSYDDIVRQRIASKLGLARTYYAGSGGSTTLESIAYEWTPEGWHPEADIDPSIDGGAAGMVSNASDLVAFMDAVIGGKIVTPYTASTMRDQEGGSGIGLRPIEIAGFSGLGERGNVGSFNSCVVHFPNRKITIAWTSNASRVPTDEILAAVLRIVLRAK